MSQGLSLGADGRAVISADWQGLGRRSQDQGEPLINTALYIRSSVGFKAGNG